VLSKWLILGMSVYDAIAAATSKAAAAIGWADRLGSLAVGREADIAVFELEAVDVMMPDCCSQLRPCKTRLRPRAVWRAGASFPISELECEWPNPESIACNRGQYEIAEVRDTVPPALPDPDMVAVLKARLGRRGETQVRRRQVGPEVGPSSAVCSYVPTGMDGSTCIVRANLTPFSPQPPSGGWPNPEIFYTDWNTFSSGMPGDVAVGALGAGAVWSPARADWIWNPVIEQVAARLAAIRMSCACPGCGPLSPNAPGDWDCTEVMR
jgi:hypothetical protein